MARRIGSVDPGETVIPADPIPADPPPGMGLGIDSPGGTPYPVDTRASAQPAAPAPTFQLPLDKYDALLKLEAAHRLDDTQLRALDTIRSKGAAPPLPQFDMSHPLVDATERKYGLPPNTLRGVVGLESYGGDPQATSPTGVHGLMQITQATGAPYGITALNRSNPYLNIEAGAHILRDLIDQHQGNFDAALNAYGGAGIGNNPANYAQIVRNNMAKFAPTSTTSPSTTSTTSTTQPPQGPDDRTPPTAQASLLPTTPTSPTPTTTTEPQRMVTQPGEVLGGPAPGPAQAPQPPLSEPGPTQPTGPSPAKLAALDHLRTLDGSPDLANYEQRLLSKYGGDKITGKAAGRLIGRTQATPDEARASGATSATPTSPPVQLRPGQMPSALAASADARPAHIGSETPTTSTFWQLLAQRNANAQGTFFDPISDQSTFPGILGRVAVGATAMPSNILGAGVEKLSGSKTAGDAAELTLAAAQIYRYGLQPATRYLWNRLPPVQRMQAARQAAQDLIQARGVAAQGLQTARTDVQAATAAAQEARALPAQITRAGAQAARRTATTAAPQVLEGAARTGDALAQDFRRITQDASYAQRTWDPRLNRVLTRIENLPEGTSRAAVRNLAGRASQGRYTGGVNTGNVSPLTQAARGRQIAAGDALSDFQRTLERAQEATNPQTQLVLARRLRDIAGRGIPELDTLDDALAAQERLTQQTLTHAGQRITVTRAAQTQAQADLATARTTAAGLPRAPRELPPAPPTGPLNALYRQATQNPMQALRYAGGTAAGWAMYRAIKRGLRTMAERER